MKKKFGVAWNERSTWAGLVWILSSAGLALFRQDLDPEQAETLTTVGTALVGLLGLLWKDR